MSKPDFLAMTFAELRKYVLEHRDDDDAVHALVLHVQQNGKRLNSTEEFEQILAERRQNSQP